MARWIAGILTKDEAVGLLGLSERSAWRLRGRLLTKGADGLVHRNRGRASPRGLDPSTRARIIELAGPHGLYLGVNDCHLAELLAAEEAIYIGRSTLQRVLRGAGLPSPRRRRSARYRSRRERMAQAGLLVQIDGSRHDWLEGRGPILTLVGGIDDASGSIVGAIFRENEDGVGYLTILHQMASDYGLPGAFYRDRSGCLSRSTAERSSPSSHRSSRAVFATSVFSPQGDRLPQQARSGRAILLVPDIPGIDPDLRLQAGRH
jgi:transposase